MRNAALRNVLAGHGDTENRNLRKRAGQLLALGVGTTLGGVLGIVFGGSMIGGSVTLVSMTMVGGLVGSAVGLKW